MYHYTDPDKFVYYYEIDGNRFFHRWREASPEEYRANKLARLTLEKEKLIKQLDYIEYQINQLGLTK